MDASIRSNKKGKNALRIRNALIVAIAFFAILYLIIQILTDKSGEIGMNLYTEFAGMAATYLIVDHVNGRRNEAPHKPAKGWVYYRLSSIIDELLVKDLPPGVLDCIGFPEKAKNIINWYLLQQTSKTLDMEQFKKARKTIDGILDHAITLVDPMPIRIWQELSQKHLDSLKCMETWSNDKECRNLANRLYAIYSGLNGLNILLKDFKEKLE